MAAVQVRKRKPSAVSPRVILSAAGVFSATVRLWSELTDLLSPPGPMWRARWLQDCRYGGGFAADIDMRIGKAKQRFHKRNGRHCWYCGVQVALHKRAKTARETIATVDHQLPLSRGGSDSRKNKVTACISCNQQKGDSTVNEFRVTLMAKGQGGYITFFGEKQEL